MRWQRNLPSRWRSSCRPMRLRVIRRPATKSLLPRSLNWWTRRRLPSPLPWKISIGPARRRANSTSAIPKPAIPKRASLEPASLEQPKASPPTRQQNHRPTPRAMKPPVQTKMHLPKSRPLRRKRLLQKMRPARNQVLRPPTRMARNQHPKLQAETQPKRIKPLPTRPKPRRQVAKRARRPLGIRIKRFPTRFGIRVRSSPRSTSASRNGRSVVTAPTNWSDGFATRSGKPRSAMPLRECSARCRR